MMISSFYIFLNYVLSLVMFFNFNNPIFFWVLMEYNLISFILILYLNKSYEIKQDSLNYVIFYFLIQSSASILFLSNFSLTDWGSIFNYDVMFLICMIFKIGLFPLFFWVFSLSEVLNILSLILLLSLQKVPLLLGLFSCNSSFLLYFLFSSFIFGSLFLIYANNLLMMFVCSSIAYSFMLFFIYLMSISSFLLFFFLYSVFLLLSLSFRLMADKDSLTNFILIFSYMFFLGLPPLGLFFFKLTFTGLLGGLMSSFELFIFWGFSFISLLGYLKLFHQSFYSCSQLFLACAYSAKMYILFFLIVLSFSFFTF